MRLVDKYQGLKFAICYFYQIRKYKIKYVQFLAFKSFTLFMLAFLFVVNHKMNPHPTQVVSHTPLSSRACPASTGSFWKGVDASRAAAVKSPGLVGLGARVLVQRMPHTVESSKHSSG